MRKQAKRNTGAKRKRNKFLHGGDESNMAKCIHYCPVGGHLWEHVVKRTREHLPACRFRVRKTNFDLTIPVTIKFFVVCLKHRIRWEEEPDDLD